jgi:hypothetical protein
MFDMVFSLYLKAPPHMKDYDPLIRGEPSPIHKSNDRVFGGREGDGYA